MAITSTNSTIEPASFSSGNLKYQVMTWSALSGATSGTVTADNMGKLYHILVLGGKLTHTAAPTFSTNVATLAFTVPAETAATGTINGILYTAAANLGAPGNNITVRLVDGTGDTPAVTAGNEVVTVSSSAITVRMDPTAVTGSTRTQVRTAVNASAAAAALVTATGTSATVAAVTAATNLTGGVTGGGFGQLLCIGAS